MIKNIIFLIAFLICASAAAAELPTPHTTLQSLNRIVAVANNDIITQSEFSHALKAAEQQLIQAGATLPDEATFRHQVMDQLIDQKLQLQVATRNHINASDSEVKEAVHQIAERNQITVTQLKNKLNQEGISYSTFSSQIRKQIILSKLQRQAVGNLTVPASEIAAFRNQHPDQTNSTQYHVATVLIPASTPAEIQQAKNSALAVAQKLRAGESFTTAMQQHSDSNDLGWRSLNDLPEIFANRIVKMRPNEIAGPIQAPNGFHIIKLLGTRAQASGLTDAQIQNILMQQKFQKALQAWLSQLRQSAYIHVNINL